jgi:hypothetical protein
MYLKGKKITKNVSLWSRIITMAGIYMQWAASKSAAEITACFFRTLVLWCQLINKKYAEGGLSQVHFFDALTELFQVPAARDRE